MRYPKIVIISDGTRAALLLDGAFYGPGVCEVSFEKKADSVPTLSIRGIDTERLLKHGVSDFEAVWAAFSRDELSPEG